MSIANTTLSARVKKIHMTLVQTPNFVEISSSANRKIVWYFAKNTNSIQNYAEFLRSLKPELTILLKKRVQEKPIKFNMKLCIIIRTWGIQ
jgi:hypothetical protein